MGIVEEAFSRLYPTESFPYLPIIKYSGKFSGYNANVRMYGRQLTFGLSRSWREVGDEIKIGLIQELLLSLRRDRRSTMNTELYNGFIKNLHIAVPKVESNPQLDASFERVNSRYFNGLLEKPNMRFGKDSVRSLGTYSYSTDTINLSVVLQNDAEALDYVMYHELLHKKLKFSHKNGRSYHHTPEFKRLEGLFENHVAIEERLKRLGRRRFLW